MSIRHGNKKRWIKVVCFDGVKRAFLCPCITNRHPTPEKPYNEKLYECGHCGERIINDPSGQLKKHKCKEEN